MELTATVRHLQDGFWRKRSPMMETVIQQEVVFCFCEKTGISLGNWKVFKKNYCRTTKQVAQQPCGCFFFRGLQLDDYVLVIHLWLISSLYVAIAGQPWRCLLEQRLQVTTCSTQAQKARKCEVWWRVRCRNVGQDVDCSPNGRGLSAQFNTIQLNERVENLP